MRQKGRRGRKLLPTKRTPPEIEQENLGQTLEFTDTKYNLESEKRAFAAAGFFPPKGEGCGGKCEKPKKKN